MPKVDPKQSPLMNKEYAEAILSGKGFRNSDEVKALVGAVYLQKKVHKSTDMASMKRMSVTKEYIKAYLAKDADALLDKVFAS